MAGHAIAPQLSNPLIGVDMPNAKTRDSRAGFAIYLQASEGITLKEINARLKKAGCGPIAQRTLTHYRNLVNAGFNRYISINRFDVARASRAYENLSTLSRYRYRITDQVIRVLFVKSGAVIEAHGRLIESGDVGAIVEFSDKSTVERLQLFKPRPGVAVTIDYSDVSTPINGIVIDCDLESDPALVEIEYTRLVSLATIQHSTALQHQLVRFELMSDDHDAATIDVVGRRLHHFFDLLEGIRSLLNEAGRHSDNYTYAAPPVVKEIRVASPAVMVLQIPAELVSLVSWPLLLILLPSWRKAWYQGTDKKRDAQVKNVERKLAELELEEKKHEAIIRAEIIDNVRSQLPNSTISDEELTKIWLSYILPSYRALRRSEVREIDASIDESRDDNGSTVNDSN